MNFDKYESKINKVIQRLDEIEDNYLGRGFPSRESRRTKHVLTDSRYMLNDLKNELNNLRLSLELYSIIFKDNPKDLLALANQEFAIEGDDAVVKRKFPVHIRVDKQGYFLDPFLNRYQYGQTTGKVSSITKGYEQW